MSPNELSKYREHPEMGLEQVEKMKGTPWEPVPGQPGMEIKIRIEDGMKKEEGDMICSCGFSCLLTMFMGFMTASRFYTYYEG